MRKILVLLGAVAILTVGCGGGSSSGSPVPLSGDVANNGTKDLSGNASDLTMNDFSFSPTFIKGGTPGTTITVHLENKGRNVHNFTVAAQGINQNVEAGHTADVQLTLPQSGTTGFHCKFHLQSNGMQGAFFFKAGA